MNRLLETVKSLFPDLVGLKETKIESLGDVVGYESTFYIQNGKAIGGGTSQDKEMARNIKQALKMFTYSEP